MDVARFDFDLPENLVALRPAVPRDAARMLVVRADESLEHAHVRDLPSFLRGGDVLVANDTRVVPARLRGRRLPREGKEGTGPSVEVLLFKRIDAHCARAFARPAKKLVTGDRLQFGALKAEVLARHEGEVTLAFDCEGAVLDAAIAREGEMPLPPYIAGKRKTDAQDAIDYQTIFAAKDGSVAAPTAGLHFTPELFAHLEQAGVARGNITLHVGPGTFLPVTAADTDAHRMHSERAEISGETARAINDARARGGRIVAAGTTTLKTLETAADTNGRLGAFSGETDLFVVPGYRFRTADILFTNFHLPRSTLFMLVCAFAGTDAMKRVYAEAVAQSYRFYSYGDACLLFRPAG